LGTRYRMESELLRGADKKGGKRDHMNATKKDKNYKGANPGT